MNDVNTETLTQKTGTLTQTSLLIAIAVVTVVGAITAASTVTNAAIVLGFCAVVNAQLFQTLLRERSEVRQTATAVAVVDKVDTMANKVEETKEAFAQAAVKSIEAVTQVDDKVVKLAAVGDVIHELVNAKMGAVLQKVVRLSRRIAELTKTQADTDALVEEETALAEHQEKQRKADIEEKEEKEQKEKKEDC